jgi:EAL domain-containing protein (putative c-di-GMP-specific phosphodiesterase class I)
MPFAEVSDAIHALTLEVLRQALDQQKIWLAQGQPATIAVNLSARNLFHAHFFSELQALLRSSDANPALLELEITETSLMQDPIAAAALLEKIAALGIRIAIDDFGTGYSSLAYLRRLPLHALKIDRTFVNELSHNAQDQVIVRSTIALAHNLNLQVIAEGVEDEATLALLRDMGCDGVQGFLFARPQPAHQIEQWLAEFTSAKKAAQP